MADETIDPSGKPGAGTARTLPGLFARPTKLAKWSLKLAIRVIRAAALVFLTILLVRAFDARRQPNLEVWHTADLEAEFRARDYRPDLTFQDYRQMEDRPPSGATPPSSSLKRRH